MAVWLRAGVFLGIWVGGPGSLWAPAFEFTFEQPLPVLSQSSCPRTTMEGSCLVTLTLEMRV